MGQCFYRFNIMAMYHITLLNDTAYWQSANNHILIYIQLFDDLKEHPSFIYIFVKYLVTHILCKHIRVPQRWYFSKKNAKTKVHIKHIVIEYYFSVTVT